MALNAERAEEERRGIIRWLGPEFQNPTGSAQTQGTLDLPAWYRGAPDAPDRFAFRS